MLRFLMVCEISLNFKKIKLADTNISVIDKGFA
jgi:hypothetical protein